MDAAAADDYAMVREMIARGMDCMRINCAHDCPDVWARMIERRDRACAELRRPLAVMRHHAAGAMIARGDLAVECGYERMAEVHEEMLWLCEAAHMPVVWATQVLDNLARKGHPSRAEITDAAMAERAECVLLNKGPYLVTAIAALDDILRRMEAHQAKKTSRLRALHLHAMRNR